MATKKILCLNTCREGYAPDQCYETMTVRELIDKLEWFDDDMLVYFRNDNGYTYGSITDAKVRDYIIEEEGEEENE